MTVNFKAWEYSLNVGEVEYCFEDTLNIIKRVVIWYDDGSTCIRILEDLTLKKPLYNPTETIEYNGNTYNKSEFEKAISSLNKIK